MAQWNCDKFANEFLWPCGPLVPFNAFTIATKSRPTNDVYFSVYSLAVYVPGLCRTCGTTYDLFSEFNMTIYVISMLK
jgi:hypothetical protein